MHSNRVEFDVTVSDPPAERVVSIVQCYPLRELIKKRISNRLSSEIDPDDVLQDLLLSIVHDTKAEIVFRMHDAGELRAWLITLIRRTVSGIIRKLNSKKRGGGFHIYGESEDQDRSRAPLLEVAYDGKARSPSSEEAEIEVKQAMRAALASLPLPYRRAVTLHYLKGIPQLKLARIMDKSEEAVRGLLQRGVHMLRGRMGPADQWFSKTESGD